MADLFDLLKSQVGETVVGALTSQLGGAKPQQTSSAVDGAMTILMNALAKKTTQGDGASALGAALDRDHDGSILNDIVGFINGNSPINQTKAANGAGILGHILGAQQGSAVEAITKMSGLNTSQSSDLLVKMAPIVLGMLGKQKKTMGLNPTDLIGMISGAANTSKAQVGNSSLLTSFLDQNGDGDIKDDAARIGFNLLKNLFRKK
jgi:hypothetical protein